MKIANVTLYVDDQEKALKFYTDKLGFQKKADFSKGDFRWLTVVSAEDPNGVELVLQRAATNPVGLAYQQGMKNAGQNAFMFMVDDVEKEYERLKGMGVEFIQPPTKVTGSTIARLDDSCGNLIQLTKLDAWK
jgi:predicted enzyme related to lactoylglutathione lyase